jgi:hypothetical protein
LCDLPRLLNGSAQSRGMYTVVSARRLLLGETRLRPPSHRRTPASQARTSRPLSSGTAAFRQNGRRRNFGDAIQSSAAVSVSRLSIPAAGMLRRRFSYTHSQKSLHPLRTPISRRDIPMVRRYPPCYRFLLCGINSALRRKSASCPPDPSISIRLQP